MLPKICSYWSKKLKNGHKIGKARMNVKLRRGESLPKLCWNDTFRTKVEHKMGKKAENLKKLISP
jgi:hypothetical protein